MIVVNLKGKDPRSIFSLNIPLSAELPETSEHWSMSDVSQNKQRKWRMESDLDVLQQNLKGLGFNLSCVAPRSNGLVVPDCGCRKQLSEAELEMRSEKSSS